MMQRKGFKCASWSIAVLLLSWAWWVPLKGDLATALKNSGWYWIIFAYAVPVLMVVSLVCLVWWLASALMKRNFGGLESSKLCCVARDVAELLLWVEATLALGLAWTAVMARDLVLGLEPLAWFWNALVLGVLVVGVGMANRGSFCGSSDSCGSCNSEREKEM